MTTEFTFSTFEVIDIILHLLTLVIVASLFINTHKGDCRGVVVSQKQNPDGHWVTREAKLSMHEAPHELQPLNNQKCEQNLCYFFNTICPLSLSYLPTHLPTFLP